MQRKFVFNLLLLVFINILVKPVWIFGIDRQVQNMTGPEQYGLYYALFNFSFLLNVILDMGITSFNNRNIAQHEQLLPKYLSNILIIKTILSGAYILFTFMWALIVGYTQYELYLLTILAFTQIVNSFIAYLRSNLAALHFFQADSFISVLDKFVMIIICLPIIWINTRFSIEWFIYAQTISCLITAAIASILVFRKSPTLQFRWNFPLLIVIIKQCYPYALLSVLMTLYIRIDAVILERMLPDGKIQAGYYAAAYRLFDATNIFAFLFAGLLLPIFARMIKNESDINDLVRLSFSMLILPCIMVCFACYFYADEIMKLLYHQETAMQVGATFPLLMFGLIGMATTYIFGTLLTANGAIKLLNAIALGGLFINIGLNLWLIPVYKANGAALSALITLSMVALVQAIYAFKHFSISFGKKYNLTILCLIIACFTSNYLTKHYISSWITGLGFAGLISAATIIISNILPIKEAGKIFSSKSSN